MDDHMTLLQSGPSSFSATGADMPTIDVSKAPTPETVEEARRIVEALERVRDQLLTTRRDLDRFIAAAEGRVGR